MIRVELVRFVRSHVAHVLVLPIMALVVTATHEAAHAIAAVVQGGTVTEFVIVPSAGNWGRMQYAFPPGTAYSREAIALAPYVFWIVLASLVVASSRRKRPFPFWLASVLFVWGFVVPLGDVANAALPYLVGARNDFSAAFGEPTPTAYAVVASAIAGAIGVGYPLERALYRERALSIRGYGVLCAFFFGAMSMLWIAF